MATAKKTSGAKLELAVTKRTAFGKQLKRLRREGVLPANIYGTGFTSVSVSVPHADFIKTYKVAKATGIVYLKLESDEIPSLIAQLQRHPIDSSILHVDFRKIDLKKKIVTEVPVKVVGVSEAVAQKGGVLLTLANTLMVEALPQDIPQAIEVDIAKLTEIGQEIKVSDLAVSDAYVVTTDAAHVIVSVTAHKEESIVAETAAAAAPEVLTAKPEGEEGTPAEGKTEAAPAAEKAEKKESK